MRRLNYILVTMVVIVIGLTESIACSCEGQGTVEGGVKYSDAVFSGTVLSKTYTSNFDSLGVRVKGDTTSTSFRLTDFPTAVVKLKVDMMYKGEFVSDTLTILTPPNGASCGVSFVKGRKYIVYAYIEDHMIMSSKLSRVSTNKKTFWTHQCTRTNNWYQEEEIDIINATR